MDTPPRRLPPFVAYAASVALDKGFSLVTIPMVAAYLSPSEFGRIEVAASLIEIVGLVLTFGIADTLIRFGGSETDKERRRRAAARFLGAALVMTSVALLVVQTLAPLLADIARVQVSETALRAGLAGATVTALVELPLVWLRLKQRTGKFLAFIALRSIVQALSMWLALRAGLGADGILISSGATVVAFALVLTIFQIRDTGIAFERSALTSMVHYGFPLVGAALAMFALGSCSRLFLVGNVTDAEIAYFGLALKLALIAPLLHQPFALWWNPRRIEVLRGADGLERSARAWSLGFGVLVIGSMAVALGGPVLVHLALPPSYAAAAGLVAPLVLVCVFNELSTLCNVGAFARSNGLTVLAVNCLGALCGIACYAVLASRFGVLGVISSMLVGHMVRLALFLRVGRRVAPIPYPFGSSVLLAAVACALVVLAPPAEMVIARLAWSGAAVAVAVLLMLQLRFIRLPTGALRAALSRGQIAGNR